MLHVILYCLGLYLIVGLTAVVTSVFVVLLTQGEFVLNKENGEPGWNWAMVGWGVAFAPPILLALILTTINLRRHGVPWTSIWYEVDEVFEMFSNQPDRKKIGLSLSRCVADIARGVIPIEDVDKVITRTRALDSARMDQVLEDYRSSKWSEFPEEAERIARELIAAGKIDQPRTRGQGFPEFEDGGHWVNSED